MELLHNLAVGFATSLTLSNLFYCFLGCLLGTLVGILPGLGPTAVIAMLLPITFTLDPAAALIMLAGIYYGAQYGGSTTAVLVNLPGEASSVVTAIDGYKMARNGNAALALSTAALASFIAGTIATLVIAVMAPLLAEAALKFGPADYFSLMVLGLVMSVVIAEGSLLKSMSMAVAGLLIGLVGIDVTSGAYRFTFGRPELAEGVSFVAVAMGIFGLSEIIGNLRSDDQGRPAYSGAMGRLLPGVDQLRRMIAPTLRGTALGSVLGVLPGGGAILSSFASYAVERKLSRHEPKVGQGALEGVAGPEAANNAGAQTSFIPMLTLGIPSNPVMALMVGAMILQGVQPGPSVMNNQPGLFWGLIVSMWIGNFFLVVLNLPLIGIWVKLLSTPYKYLFPTIMVFCAVGVFTLRGFEFDVYVLIGFAFLGYLLRLLDYPPAPLLLGIVLGPMMEEYLRRALLLSRGDPLVFVQKPISFVLLLMVAVALALVLLPAFRRTREQVVLD